MNELGSKSSANDQLSKHGSNQTEKEKIDADIESIGIV
jgi:hypothetical protein